MSIVSGSYEEWQHCITVKCRMPLTAENVAQRLHAPDNTRDYHTGEFIDRRGQAHHHVTLARFHAAEKRLTR